MTRLPSASTTSVPCIRIPINYRHFIDPLNPSVIKPDGFKLLDRIVDADAV